MKDEGEIVFTITSGDILHSPVPDEPFPDGEIINDSPFAPILELHGPFRVVRDPGGDPEFMEFDRSVDRALASLKQRYSKHDVSSDETKVV